MSVAAKLAKVKAVASGGVLRLLDEGAYKREVKRLALGEGEPVVIMVMREADAKAHHQLKWYYGYIVKQCMDYTGDQETDHMFRGLFMPQDVETLSLMTYEQMAEFNRQCEAYAANTIGIVIQGPDSARTWAV